MCVVNVHVWPFLVFECRNKVRGAYRNACVASVSVRVHANSTQFRPVLFAWRIVPGSRESADTYAEGHQNPGMQHAARLSLE